MINTPEVEEEYIRLATKDESFEIIDFIKKYWRQDHIYVRDHKFFAYELKSQESLQFAIARINHEIAGIVGFIQYRENLNNSDIFLVILRVLEQFSNRGLGLKLVQFCRTLTNRDVHAIGVKSQVLPLYSLLGFYTGWLDHFYWVNDSLQTYKLAFIDPKFRPTKQIPPSVSFKQLNGQVTEQDMKKLEFHPQVRKSLWFINRRYINHPYYRYLLFRPEKHTTKEQYGIGVLRIVEYKKARAVRIVDWLGSPELFGEFCAFSTSIATSTSSEYVDLYCTGMPRDSILNAGFKPITKIDIIPSHFTPFKRENIRLSFVSTATNNLVMFRGDGDQDRPS